MATATESNNMVNDAFADLSATTQKSVSSIFDTVSAGAGQNNEQLRRTLESTIETIEMMNSVEADLKAKATEGYEVRKDLEAAQAALQDVTGTVASAAVDAEHEAMADQPKAPKLG
jgi:vacuolar-type H+-ATPase subunit I/STV1